jgi:hypothetical protein
MENFLCLTKRWKFFRAVVLTQAEAPDPIVGRRVEKQFGSKWHVGKVVSTEIDNDANETIWHVKHDDSDSEGYYCAREIGAALLDTDDEGSNSDEGASCASGSPSPKQFLRALLSPKFNARYEEPTDKHKK